MTYAYKHTLYASYIGYITQAIINNPLYAITNPQMYAATFVVRDAMSVVRWTR